MKQTTPLALVMALLLGVLAPSHVAGVEQVQAVFALTGVCFPVKENLVTSFINTVVNPTTNTPWGAVRQSGAYETLCNLLPDGCTDIPGSGTDRAPAPPPAAPTPKPGSPAPPAGKPPASPTGGIPSNDYGLGSSDYGFGSGDYRNLPLTGGDDSSRSDEGAPSGAPAPAATPAPALAPADSPALAPAPADSSLDYSREARGARAMPPAPSDGKDLKLGSSSGSASSGSGSLLQEDSALADLISGSVSSLKPSDGAARALGSRRLLWLEAPGLGQGPGQGRGLLQDASCSGKTTYIYLDTTNPADPEAVMQMIKDSINTGDFISKMDIIPGLRPESVILKDIKTVEFKVPDVPPPPPTDDAGAPDSWPPPTDYESSDYAPDHPDFRSVEQVRAVLVFEGPCFPVPDSQVTEIILVVNALTSVPWGATEQSAGFSSLCAKLANANKLVEGCPTDSDDSNDDGGGSGRRLLKGATCYKWYLYLETTNEKGSSKAITQSLTEGIDNGEFMTMLEAAGVKVKSADYKMVLAYPSTTALGRGSTPGTAAAGCRR